MDEVEDGAPLDILEPFEATKRERRGIGVHDGVVAVDDDRVRAQLDQTTVALLAVGGLAHCPQRHANKDEQQGAAAHGEDDPAQRHAYEEVVEHRHQDQVDEQEQGDDDADQQAGALQRKVQPRSMAFGESAARARFYSGIWPVIPSLRGISAVRARDSSLRSE